MVGEKTDDSWKKTRELGEAGYIYYKESPDIRQCPACESVFGIDIDWEDQTKWPGASIMCPFCGVPINTNDSYKTKW
jgi:hypothetical protein